MTREQEIVWWSLFIIFALMIIVALLAGMRHAQARDPDGRFVNSPYAEWFKSQHNAEGQYCCSEADGHAFYGNYRLNEDGSVTLNPGAENEHWLPASMVLHNPNPTGVAIWWYQEFDRYHKDYCFAPGTLG